MIAQALRIKSQCHSSIKNKILCSNITAIHKSLNIHKCLSFNMIYYWNMTLIIKHYHLGQIFTSIFQPNLRIKIRNQDSNFSNKMTIPINNQECNIITSIHKSLTRLLPIPKRRISHSCWPLQAWKARKEDSGCFSLTTTSSSNTIQVAK